MQLCELQYSEKQTRGSLEAVRDKKNALGTRDVQPLRNWRSLKYSRPLARRGLLDSARQRLHELFHTDGEQPQTGSGQAASSGSQGEAGQPGEAGQHGELGQGDEGSQGGTQESTHANVAPHVRTQGEHTHPERNQIGAAGAGHIPYVRMGPGRNGQNAPGQAVRIQLQTGAELEGTLSIQISGCLPQD